MELTYDVIIIGGSYAGLSAAMALGRAIRRVLIIDSGLPCNRYTPHSHNFLTQDGETPNAIADKALAQVLRYDTVSIIHDVAISAYIDNNTITVNTSSGKVYQSNKLILATGIKDIFPDIMGFSECWGKTVIHCPYCHGYEVKNKRTGIIANDSMALHYAQLILNWTKNLILFTNGKSIIPENDSAILKQRGIAVIEKEIASVIHNNGALEAVEFKDASTHKLDALYTKPQFQQSCPIPELLGCDFTEQGHLVVDQFQKTSIKGVFACGDNSNMMRSVAMAVATGNMAGAMANKELIDEAII